MDLAGNKVTIAGPKRDTTQLPVDWLDTANAEFPNSVQVGTIDTNPIYTFSDFGGAPADCCWDPRDPYICGAVAMCVGIGFSAVSGCVSILDQAARSIGVSASLWLSVCHPSTLRMVI